MSSDTVNEVSKPPKIYEIIKVLVLGAARVGKTSLIKRLVGEDFNENQTPTLYDVYEKEIESEHGDFIFQFTDSGGSRSFPPMRQLEMSKSDICLLVYSTNDMKTIEVAKRLKGEIEIAEKKLEIEIPYILVGNKVDLQQLEAEEHIEQNSSVSSVMALESTCVSHVLTSAKTGINVFNLMKTLSSEGEAINFSNYGSCMKRQLSGMTNHYIKF